MTACGALRRAPAAREQAWLRAVMERPHGAPVLGFCWYRRAALVVGPATRMPIDGVATALPTVRRGSGGGAVLAGPWLLGSALVLPVDHPVATGGIRSASEWFGDRHGEALAALGVDTHRAEPPARPTSHLAWACYGSLGPGERVNAHRRKILGVAQRRGARATLLVAGVLIAATPWIRMTRALGRPDDEAAALADATAWVDVDPPRLATTMHEVLVAHLGAGTAPRPPVAARRDGGAHCTAWTPPAPAATASSSASPSTTPVMARTPGDRCRAPTG